MRILFFGDIIGKSARETLAKILPELKARFEPDLVLANAENIAHGKGITLSTIEPLLEAGIDFFTSGNHIFDKPGAKEVFERYAENLIRPANFEGNFPGQGFKVLKSRGVPVLVINLNGQVFMEKQFDFGKIGNPFQKLNQILHEQQDQAKIRLLDFHAEATSEKRAMGFFTDGRLSAVIGTHTHVLTADAQILPQGTGYITDAGMVGAADSVIGVEISGALNRLLAGEESTEKSSVEVAESSKIEATYVVLEIDAATGKCQNIIGERILI